MIDTATELSATLTVAAPREQVWRLVTDVGRMSEWSGQVARTWVLGGAVKAGTRFVNLNHQGWKHWPTNAKVVRFTPMSDFAFRIVENRTVWSFRLEDAGPGQTLVTHRRETPEGISALSRGLVGIALGGQERFTAGLAEGMRQTLERIKAEAEG